MSESGNRRFSGNLAATNSETPQFHLQHLLLGKSIARSLSMEMRTRELKREESHASLLANGHFTFYWELLSIRPKCLAEKENRGPKYLRVGLYYYHGRLKKEGNNLVYEYCELLCSKCRVEVFIQKIIKISRAF